MGDNRPPGFHFYEDRKESEERAFLRRAVQKELALENWATHMAGHI
jgi:hypothetical protein